MIEETETGAPNLPNTATKAWQAYTKMRYTKQNHLDYLRHLEDKYQKYGQPSNTEANHLEILLQEHDKQVTLFKTTLQELKKNHPDAHKTFITYLAKPGV